ncbi:MAG: hypothetical protein C0413_03355 [Clostridiales bacterium]|nr:hypothetical protein [Clostridiales bacterium]
MNNTWKKAVSVLIAVALTLSFAACGKGANNASNSNAADPNRDKIAVRIGKGDDFTITKGEIEDQYGYMVSMYAQYGMSAPSVDEDIETMQNDVIASLVIEKLKLYQTGQLGIILTSEQTADIEKQVDEQMKSYTDMFREQAKTEGAADVEARALEIFQEQIDAAGMELDIDGFRDFMLKGYTEEALKEALKDQITKDVTATDEEIQTYYNDLLASQKETYTTTPADYSQAAEDFQINGGDPMLYTPEGFVRVRSIAISPATELPAEYTTLKDEMTAIESQYGAAALKALADKYAAKSADASDTSISVTTGEIEGGAALVSDYVTKKAAADAMYEDYIKDAREKANEALASLEAGTSFEDVLGKYGEDSIYTEYPAFVETGLLMYVGGEDTLWDAELVKAVGLLKDGEHTAIIQVDDMFYILQLVGSEPAGEKSLTDAYESVKAAVIAQNSDQLWNTQLETWQTDKKIVTYYEDVYRGIGKE